MPKTDAALADPELIDLRPDERLDLARLEPYLRERLPKTDGDIAVGQFGGGHANLTYLIKFGDAEYVLRRPPLGPVAPTSHDMKREFRVLSKLSRAFALAPDSYVYCDDLAIIGAEFQVMERRQGFVIRLDLPEAARGDTDLERRVGEMMIDALADFHLVDHEAAGLGDLGRPEGFVERQLAGWTKRWHAAKDRDLPRIDQVISWLETNIPRSPLVSLLHNDYKLDNILVANDDPGTAAAILDWDMCTTGDPLMDLGYLLNFWHDEGDDPAWIDAAPNPTWRGGFPSRDEAVQRYCARTGYDVGDVRWYYVFGVFKIAVILQQIYIRFLRGQTQDDRFAAFGARIAALADKAAFLAQE